MFEIRSDRLVIRPVLPKDLDPIWEASQIPGFFDGMLWVPPKSKQEVEKELLEETISAFNIPLVITHDDRFCGRLFIRRDEGKWGVGFWLLPSERGKGFATEAAEAASVYIFKSLGANAVYASCMPWNHASRKVIRRLGMKMVNPKRYVWKAGKQLEVEEYVLSKSAFPIYSSERKGEMVEM